MTDPSLEMTISSVMMWTNHLPNDMPKDRLRGFHQELTSAIQDWFNNHPTFRGIEKAIEDVRDSCAVPGLVEDGFDAIFALIPERD